MARTSARKVIELVIKRDECWLWTDKKADRGGETYAGIARNMHPTWEGWVKIDLVKRQFGSDRGDAFQKALADDPVLHEAVYQFYSTNFWKFGQIESENIAVKLFSMAINMGVPECITLLQRAINYVRHAEVVEVDGVMGQQTYRQTSLTDSDALMQELKARACWYYAQVHEHQHDETFVMEWMRRALR